MGAKTTGNGAGVAGEIKTGTDGKGNRNPSTGSEKAGTGAGRKTNRRTAGAETGAESAKEEKGSAGLSPVTEQKDPVEIVVGADGEQKPKPKKRTRKKKNTSTVSSGQLEILIVTLSAVMASRPGWEHWALKPDEAKQIAVPLMAMVENSEALGKMAEHSEAVALIGACLIVFLPRVMITAQKSKVAREQKKLEKKGVTISDDKVRKADDDNRRNAGRNADDGANDGGGLSATIPPLAI